MHKGQGANPMFCALNAQASIAAEIMAISAKNRRELFAANLLIMQLIKFIKIIFIALLLMILRFFQLIY